MPLEQPSQENDYQVTDDHTLNSALLNAITLSIALRLKAREDLEANFEALIDQGYADALTQIQVNLNPELATLQQSVTDAQDAISDILTNGVAPDSAKLGGVDAAQYALKSYVDSIIDAAPGQLDTLNELSAAIGNDENFAATMTAALASKLSISGGSVSGDIDMAGNGIVNPGNIYTKTEVDAQIEGSGGSLFKGNNGEVGSSADDIFRVHAKTLTSDVIIDGDENASCTGPLEIADGVTLTIADGGVLAVN